MHLTIALPGLFWQDIGDLDYIYSNTKTDNFNHILKHAKQSKVPTSFSDLVYSLNSVPGSLASHMAQQLGINKEYSQFLLAEPTHLRLDRDRLLISESELLQLDADEAKSIIQTINQHFNPDIKLYYITENLWLIGHNLQCGDSRFYSILDIAGENIDEFLPDIKLNKLINEIQMLLYDIPENQARKYEGSLAVNSIWLWDKQPEAMQFTKIYANNISPLNTIAEPIPTPIETAFGDNNLIVIDNLYYPCNYRDAFGWVDKLNSLDLTVGPIFKKWLEQNNTLDILIPGRDNGARLSIRRSYKFWQKQQLINLVKEFHAL